MLRPKTGLEALHEASGQAALKIQSTGGTTRCLISEFARNCPTICQGANPSEIGMKARFIAVHAIRRSFADLPHVDIAHNISAIETMIVTEKAQRDTSGSVNMLGFFRDEVPA